MTKSHPAVLRATFLDSPSLEYVNLVKVVFLPGSKPVETVNSPKLISVLFR